MQEIVMTRVSPQYLLPSFLLVAALSSGCLNDARVLAPDSESLAPQSEHSTGRSEQVTFPLAVGNRWVFRTRQVNQVSENGGPFVVFQDVTWRTTRELFCEQLRADDHLMMVAETFQLPSSGNFGTWQYREDRHGLWRPASPLPLPAECEPPFLAAEAHTYSATSAGDIVRRPFDIGVEALRREPPPPSNEDRLLAYPLHVGRTWLMGGKGGIRCTVEAYEQLDLPIGREFAFRIRLEWPYLAPGEQFQYLVWYGASGYLQTQFHTESVRTNPDGSTRHQINDYTEVVQSVYLVEPGSSSAIRGLGGMAP